jgi:hypothetical protein
MWGERGDQKTYMLLGLKNTIVVSFAIDGSLLPL